MKGMSITWASRCSSISRMSRFTSQSPWKGLLPLRTKVSSCLPSKSLPSGILGHSSWPYIIESESSRKYDIDIRERTRA